MKGATRSADAERRRADLVAALVDGPAEKILAIMFEQQTTTHAPEE